MEIAMEDLPWGTVMFASTMASFVLLRKVGKAHLLMPHQRSIGVAVGWTMASSLLAFLGLFVYGSPQSRFHIPTVFLPQQAVFAVSMLLRGEVDVLQVGLALSCLAGISALLFLRASEEVVSPVPLSVICAVVMAITLTPFLHAKMKVLLGCWSLIGFAPVLFDVLLPPLAPLLLLEWIGLLAVKLQFLETDLSKVKEKQGWKW